MLSRGYTEGEIVESNAMLLKRWSVCASLVLIGVATAVAIQAGLKLTINGKLVKDVFSLFERKICF